MGSVDIEGLILFEAKTFKDERGFFRETFRAAEFAKMGLSFVQDNESLSKAGVLRGLHFQRPPHTQAKLVRVSRGRAFDVAVDLRPGSKTYRQWAAYTLSAENGQQLFIPKGFAHGFLALEDDTVLSYKVSDYYDPDCDGGVLWNDPAIAVEWPCSKPQLSVKDAALPSLAELGRVF
jgi:dTDP-4-dehydrorhamnose 3,5-epimerase